MIIVANDSQVVSEVQSTLWSTVQQGPVNMTLVIKNSGVNTMNYQIQEFTGTVWQVIGNAPPGSDYYNTLSPNQVAIFIVQSSYSQVQMVGNASGGAFLEFSTTRYFNRASGGAIPLLSF
jgi:hypothetical protein